MSSFIVEDITINRVLNWLFWINKSSYVEERIKEVTGVTYKGNSDEQTEKELQLLGNLMFALNLRGTSQRYKTNPKQTVAEFEVKPFKFKWLKYKEYKNKYQVLKSLRCFLYQCAEGDTEEQPLYLMLREVEYELMDDIIRELPKYDAAKWG